MFSWFMGMFIHLAVFFLQTMVVQYSMGYGYLTIIRLGEHEK